MPRPDSAVVRPAEAIVRIDHLRLTTRGSLLPGFADAKAYSRLGMMYYGFSPVRSKLQDGISVAALYHGANERIPEAGLRWGLRTLWAAGRFAGAV